MGWRAALWERFFWGRDGGGSDAAGDPRFRGEERVEGVTMCVCNVWALLMLTP